MKNLRIFGEVGYILKRNKIKSEISNHGKKGIMIGYMKQSAGDTYRMFNLETNMVTNTRDVKWTKKLYGEHGKTDKNVQDDYYTASEDNDDDIKDEQSDNEDSEDKPRRSP